MAHLPEGQRPSATSGGTAADFLGKATPTSVLAQMLRFLRFSVAVVRAADLSYNASNWGEAECFPPRNSSSYARKRR
jgi:hypothetical protein